MAYVSAAVEQYLHTKNGLGETVGLTLIGTITDSVLGDWRGAHHIEGDAFASLPAEDPETTGTPACPRFMAIAGSWARFVKERHTAWVAAEAAKTTTVEGKTAEEISQLPVLDAAMLAALTVEPEPEPA